MQAYDILALAGLRIDGRRPHDLRAMKHKIGSAGSADGSAYLEQGLNKVLVMIHGPQEQKRRQLDQISDNCNIVVRLENAPFSGTERKTRRVGDKRTLEVEATVRQVVEEVVLLDIYPKAEIEIVIHILESDGSTICCVLNALSLALMDAGIAMNEMIAACSVGYVKQELCSDLTQIEQNAGGAYMPIVVKAKSEEIVFMQLDSRLSPEKLNEALSSGVKSCLMVQKYLETAIRGENGQR